MEIVHHFTLFISFPRISIHRNHFYKIVVGPILSHSLNVQQFHSKNLGFFDMIWTKYRRFFFKSLVSPSNIKILGSLWVFDDAESNSNIKNMMEKLQNSYFTNTILLDSDQKLTLQTKSLNI